MEVMDDPKLLRIPLEDLTQGEIIGRGSFGTVIRAFWSATEVAVKFFQPDQELLDAFSVEANQLSRVCHPNIIRLLGGSFSPPHVFLVMEYADSGSLYKILHQSCVSYTSGHAVHWLLQAARGVEYLHGLKPTPIAHRDLKSPNLLLVRAGLGLKLCDFGTACGVQTYMTNNKGSAAWMAPEVFEGNKYTEKCDIYSHGILTWEVLTRRLPFDEIKGNNCRILWAIHQGKRPPLISGCPSVLEDLMTKCWDKNPSVRPSMSKIVQTLSFIQKFFPSVENDPLQLETLSKEDLKEDETGSYVSALTSLHSRSEVKNKPLIASSEEYPEKLPSVINTNPPHPPSFAKKGFYTPPELVDSGGELDVLPPLPSMDPNSLLNAPPELTRSLGLWVEEDSGPIPSDIEVVRDGDEQLRVPPSKDTFQFFEPPYRPLYPHPSFANPRYPLSDFRPSVGGNDPYAPEGSLSGRNYPFGGKIPPSSSRNLSSPHSMRRNNSKSQISNGLFSVHEDPGDKSSGTFKKGHRRASSYGSSGGIPAAEGGDTRPPSSANYHDPYGGHPPDLRRSYSDLSTPRSNIYDYYESDSIVDRAVELIDPDLRPVPPQPNCHQSMQIYHNHRQLASEYVKIKSKLERLLEYKASLERGLREEEGLHDDDEDREECVQSHISAADLTAAANQEEVENYVRKKSERDSLLQFQEKLFKQLKLLKSISEGDAPSAEDNEWVIVNQ